MAKGFLMLLPPGPEEWSMLDRQPNMQLRKSETIPESSCRCHGACQAAESTAA
jgi:hypothetical protein